MSRGKGKSVIQLGHSQKTVIAGSVEVNKIARGLLAKYRKAFEKLSK
ncbi:MAG: hypothetical protein GX340_10100 [Clostridiales bacterium]|nr:hypothetical protein [Clostridiales bacterium]